ncbi:MAG: type IV pili methyl-accepting chemotaxis transducer N-terminal domain-containing protein [Pirellulales bacterium]
MRLILQAADVANDRASRQAELRASLGQWRRSHDELSRGDASVGHRTGNSPAAAEIYARLQPKFAAMSSAAERIVSNDSVPQPSDVAVLLAEEPTFLEAMDAIVADYERKAQAKVARLRTLESVLLVLTLGTLLLEGVYVFRPAVRQIRRSFAALVRLGEELRGPRHGRIGQSSEVAVSRERQS